MTTTSRPTADQQCVIDAPLYGPHIIDAGAGTGKTFTLVERAIKLVREEQLRPDELLVITFAEKAAAEIRDRMLQAFRTGGHREAPTCKTFHALAQSIRLEFGFTPGWSPDSEVADEQRTREIFAEAFAQWRAGKLGVDIDAVPFLDRPTVLEENLAKLVLKLKDVAIPLEAFEREALDAAAELDRIPFGQLWKPRILRGNPTGERDPKSLRPPRERSPEERHAEAERERRNVRAVAALFRRFDELLRAQGLATFGDLLLDAERMLRLHPEIAETLRSRWKHALVDELQDTSPVQIAFLHALFGQELRPVLGVGDVRQAIYGFRNADPSVMRRFRELAGEERVFVLERNRRSVQEILDAARAVMESSTDPLLPAKHDLIAERRTEERDRGEIAVRLQAIVAESADEVRACEATLIAGEIARLLADGVRPEEIAILMRSRTHAEPFRQALHELGIPAKIHGGGGLYGTAEIRTAVAWLRWLTDSRDDRAALRVAQSDAARLSDGALAALAAGRGVAKGLLEGVSSTLGTADAAALQRLRGAYAVCASVAAEPPALAAARAIAELGLDIAAEVHEPERVSQLCANLARLVEIAEEFGAEHPGATLEDFAAEVRCDIDAEAQAAEPAIGGEEVGIYTVHAAKGLEWDYVFVANVSRQSFPLDFQNWLETTVLYDTNSERRSAALAFKNAVDGTENLRWSLARVDYDPLTGEYDTRKSEHHEETRLFYVALTRARRRISITGRARGQGATSELLKTLHGWAAGTATPPEGRGIGTVQTDPVPRVELLPAGNVPERDRQLALRVFGRRPLAAELPARAVSFTALSTHRRCPRRARYQYLMRLPDLREESLPAKSDGEGQVRETRLGADVYGDLVHYALELLAHDAFDAGKIPEAVEAALAQDEVAPASAEVRARAFADVTAACERLQELEPEPNGIEYEFATTLAGVPVYGFIDLVARGRDGGRWVIDYKTGLAPDEDYRAQLTLYARALAAVEGSTGPEHLALMRIGDGRAELSELAPISDAEFEELLRAAARLDDDTPKPGPHCWGCPYRHAPCEAAV